MSDYKSALDRVGSLLPPVPVGLESLAARVQRRRTRRRVGVAIVALLVAGAGIGGAYLALYPSKVTRVGGERAGGLENETSDQCQTLIPECNMERLPNRTLRGDEVYGALRSVGEIPEDLIAFDDALTRAWAEDGHGAAAVQVVLGAANPAELHWESNSDLFYAVTWLDVCLVHSNRTGTPKSPMCGRSDWITIIDAETGAFIVGGTADL